ncbi:MAG TPA: flippase [Cyclobacteriaceae bacterium]|nr:flippase [Cyclobacteriaceae bacterium]
MTQQSPPAASKYVKNVFWLFSDRILRMVLGVFVSVWVARYLEPDLFGKWNYALAYVAIFTAMANLGIDSIVVRTIVRYPAKANVVLGSGFVLLVIGNVIMFLACMLSAIVTEGLSAESFYVILITSLNLLFNSYFIVEYWIQAKLQSKYTFWAQNIAFVVGNSFKLYLLISHAKFEYFIWISVVEAATLFFTYFVIFKKKFGAFSDWKFSPRMASLIFKNSWVLIVTNLAIILYMRIDQVMIGKMLSNSDVGIYSAAVKVAELWYFVPMAIVTSLFPLILEIRDRDKPNYLPSMQLLYIGLTWMGIGVAVFFTLFANFIVGLIYGTEYLGAAVPLSISIWCGVFVAQGIARGRWLVAENLQSYSIWYVGSGAIVNIGLNFVLIPAYGIVGACVATLVAQGTVSILAPLMFPKTRISSVMLIKAINPVPLVTFLLKWRSTRQTG